MSSFEFCTNFTLCLHEALLQHIQLGKVMVLGTIWPWWVRFRRDLGWMMQNESGARVGDLNMPPSKPKTCISLKQPSCLGQIHVNVNVSFKRLPFTKATNLLGAYVQQCNMHICDHRYIQALRHCH